MPAAKRSQREFVDELPELLAVRGLSVRALALQVGVTPTFLYRVLHRKDYKTPSAELAGKVAKALELPEDYWPEYRAGKVAERMKADPRFRDTAYDLLG